MKRKTWNSWTFTGSDDDAGRSHGDMVESGVPGRIRGKNAESTWLERSFQESLGHALEQAMDLSEVRMDRVERVRAAIAAGRYRIPSEVVAERLMQNMMGNY